MICLRNPVGNSDRRRETLSSACAACPTPSTLACLQPPRGRAATVEAQVELQPLPRIGDHGL